MAKSNKKIGIVQCGYGDCIPYIFSNRGFVFYDDKKIEIIGRVSMDLIAINIKNIKCVEGEWVTIWGGKRDASRLENIASFHENIPYTYITGITERVNRVYVD